MTYFRREKNLPIELHNVVCAYEHIKKYGVTEIFLDLIGSDEHLPFDWTVESMEAYMKSAAWKRQLNKYQQKTIADIVKLFKDDADVISENVYPLPKEKDANTAISELGSLYSFIINYDVLKTSDSYETFLKKLDKVTKSFKFHKNVSKTVTITDDMLPMDDIDEERKPYQILHELRKRNLPRWTGPSVKLTTESFVSAGFDAKSIEKFLKEWFTLNEVIDDWDYLGLFHEIDGLKDPITSIDTWKIIATMVVFDAWGISLFLNTQISDGIASVYHSAIDLKR